MFIGWLLWVHFQHLESGGVMLVYGVYCRIAKNISTRKIGFAMKLPNCQKYVNGRKEKMGKHIEVQCRKYGWTACSE